MALLLVCVCGDVLRTPGALLKYRPTQHTLYIAPGFIRCDDTLLLYFVSLSSIWACKLTLNRPEGWQLMVTGFTG